MTSPFDHARALLAARHADIRPHANDFADALETILGIVGENEEYADALTYSPASGMPARSPASRAELSIGPVVIASRSLGMAVGNGIPWSVIAEKHAPRVTKALDGLRSEIREMHQALVDAETEASDLKEQRAAFGDDLDRAFTDGYGAAYMASKRTMAGYQGFVAMAEYADDAAEALVEWHKDNGDSVENACVGCGSTIDEGKTHCGSLECGGGRLPEVAPRRCCDLYPDCMHEVIGESDPKAIDDTWSAP